jgi:hypothetical protein
MFGFEVINYVELTGMRRKGKKIGKGTIAPNQYLR